MRLLIATADIWWARLLHQQATDWGFDVDLANNLSAAVLALSSSSAPTLVLIDSVLPPTRVVEACQLIRNQENAARPYLVVTSLTPCRTRAAEVLDAGADDFLAFPTDLEELRARLEAARRLLAWHRDRLHPRHGEMVTLCAHCKRARLPEEGWRPIETLLSRLGQQVSHGICPGCYHAWVEPELMALAASSEGCARVASSF